MESITIYPKDEKQTSLLKSLLKELKIRFEVAPNGDNTQLSIDEFYSKIDKSIEQAEAEQTQRISKEQQKEFLGL